MKTISTTYPQKTYSNEHKIIKDSNVFSIIKIEK